MRREYKYKSSASKVFETDKKLSDVWSFVFSNVPLAEQYMLKGKIQISITRYEKAHNEQQV